MSNKRPSRQVTQEIRRVLTSESEGSNWPTDLTWAHGFLGGVDAPPPESMDQEVLIGLIDELLHRQDNDRLSTLARAPHKGIAKAARTAIHRLRSRKVDMAVPGAEPRKRGSGNSPGCSTLPDSMATPYEPDWRRHVFLLDPGVSGSINVYWGRISAYKGLVELELLKSMTRKELRGMMGRFKEVVDLVSIPRSEAHWFIADAADRCRATGHTLPSGFAAMTTQVGGAPSGDHPALTRPPHPEADHQALMELYKGEELRGWVPDQALMQRMVMRLQEVTTSRLVLDEQQRRSRIANVIDSNLEEVFDDQGCAAGRQVMLDTAQLLHCKGDDERGSLFRAAAELFSLPPERAVVHPFVRHYLERLLHMDALLAGPEAAEAAQREAMSKQEQEQEQEKGEAGSSGIILTGSPGTGE